MRKIIYIDLDNTLADYIGEANRLNISLKDAKHIKGFFKQLKPMPGAIESYNKLSEHLTSKGLPSGTTTHPGEMPTSSPRGIRIILSFLKQLHNYDLN